MKRAGILLLAFGILIAPSHSQAPRFPIMETTVDDIHAAYKAGSLTARQLVEAYIDRIKTYDAQGPKINSVITINSQAVADADKLDAAFKKSGLTGPLHGIPILIKDEIDTAGMPTTLGSIVFKNYRPTRDAFVVERLRNAGAIILGKTTLSEFAAGDTYSGLFGATRNPYNLERTVGGSSGGSAAALAANFSALAVGEETVASIRRPATCNESGLHRVGRSGHDCRSYQRTSRTKRSRNFDPAKTISGRSGLHYEGPGSESRDPRS